SYKFSKASAKFSSTTASNGMIGLLFSLSSPKKSTLNPFRIFLPEGNPSESKSSLILSTTPVIVATALGPLRFLTSSVVIRLKNLPLSCSLQRLVPSCEMYSLSSNDPCTCTKSASFLSPASALDSYSLITVSYPVYNPLILPSRLNLLE